MKKFIVALISTLTLALSISIATAGATSHTSQYWICTTPSLKAVWQYPSGTYWQNQISHYPDYYSANNAYYLAKYGC